MDPEDLREVISAYQKCVAESVGRCGGFVAKYMGDGVLVYFGYPQANEDDPEQAVRAGLDLVAAVTGPKVHTALQTRVGIATGLARISHSVRRIGTPNQRKFFCEKDFAMIRGAPRCRQSVAQNSLILEWWKAAPSKRRWARTHSGLASSALARPRSVRTTCAAVSAGFHANV